jgi:tetratricopeptide (TPR) repeat protein
MNNSLTTSNIRVIHTRGTDREIGAQHAQLLGPCVNEGMVLYFELLWKNLTDGSGRGWAEQMTLSAFRNTVAPYLKGKLVRQIPEFARQRLEGMGAVCGLPVERLLPLLVLPDFGPILQAMQSQWFPNRFVEFQPPSFGCSSFFVGRDPFYFGRNLDFPGTNYWDRYPVIQYFDRTEGLKYLGFTSAGIPFGGISGINEAGISVALHQHFSNRYRWDGQLPFFISEKVLQNAQTLEQAVALIEESRVASAWAFLIADSRQRKAAIVEALPDRKSVRYWNPSDAPLAHSNYLVTDACRECETSASARMSWDNYYRRKRLEDRLLEMGDAFSPALGVQLLGDGWDPYWEQEKVLNRVVSQNYNIKSMLLDLTNRKLWMAENTAPPIHLGKYSEFDLSEIFAGKTGYTGQSLPGFRFKEPFMEKAKTLLVQGYMAGSARNTAAAIKRLGEVLDLQFSPEVAQIRGVLFLQTGETRAALREFQKAQQWIENQMDRMGKAGPPPEYFEAMLFEARALDILGERRLALATYKKLANDNRLQDANLRSIAQSGRPYTLAKAKAIFMPFSTYVPFQ